MHRQRLYAFVISGALAGFAGGLLVHELGSITTQQVYLDLTFLTLAMLVVGGVASLWGAVVGALLVSGLDSFLNDAEQGVHVGFDLTLPDRDAPRRDRRADGDRPDPPAVRDHRRPRGHAPTPARPRRKRPEPPLLGSSCRSRPTGGRRASRSSTSGS